ARVVHRGELKAAGRFAQVSFGFSWHRRPYQLLESDYIQRTDTWLSGGAFGGRRVSKIASGFRGRSRKQCRGCTGVAGSRLIQRRAGGIDSRERAAESVESFRGGHLPATRVAGQKLECRTA